MFFSCNKIWFFFSRAVSLVYLLCDIFSGLSHFSLEIKCISFQFTFFIACWNLTTLLYFYTLIFLIQTPWQSLLIILVIYQVIGIFCSLLCVCVYACVCEYLCKSIKTYLLCLILTSWYSKSCIRSYFLSEQRLQKMFNSNFGNP